MGYGYFYERKITYIYDNDDNNRPVSIVASENFRMV